jgi:hypothetical protein
METLNTYFDKYNTFAAGNVSVGHNLGLVIFADLIFPLDKNFGWKEMIIFLGGIT